MKYLFPIAVIGVIILFIKSKYKLALVISGLLLLYYIAMSLILAQGLS